MTGEEATVLEAPEEFEGVTEFEGYGPAAAYLGLKRNTLSSYMARGRGPKAEDKPRARGQYNLPVFTRANLDAWKESRPGQGARTDLVQAAA